MSVKDHWNKAYAEKPTVGLSWYQPIPARSLDLITGCLDGLDPIIADIGGGASLLVDHLLDRGFQNIMVLDISDEAIRLAKLRLGSRSGMVQWHVGNVTDFDPSRPIDLWHDRAVLHFLTDERDQARYQSTLENSLSECGRGVIATFALDGPKRCSGLPVVRYGPEKMRAFLGSRFQLLDFVRETHVTPGGVGQSFIFFRFRRRN